MKFCSFCGKGPFSVSSRLKKHITNSENCNIAACQEWDTYAKRIWDNASPRSENDPQPPNLEQDRPPNLPDDTLEEDIQAIEEFTVSTVPEIGPPERKHRRSTVDDAEDEKLETAHFIQEFTTNLGAGVVWEEEVPFFEKIQCEQVLNGSSSWGPFDDEDDWQLAEWLIRNIEQNQLQIDTFLNLNIVCDVFSFDN